MSDSLPPRSPALLDRRRSVLVVIDWQPKLLAAVAGADRLAFQIDRLTEGAGLFEIPVVGTQQYPQGLGEVGPELRPALSELHDKTVFSCRECQPQVAAFQQEGRRQVVLAGIETHVCVLQTAFDLMAEGFEVIVVADAVGSRAALDHDLGLRRMDSGGVTLVTTESVLFEWCEDSRDPQFKAVSGLIRRAL